MSDKRTGVYFRPDVRALLNTGDTNVSSRANSIVIRYARACAEYCPELTLAQWSELMQALRDHWLALMTPEDATARDLAEHSGLSPQTRKEVERLGYIERVAVLEVAQRYWATETEDEESRLRVAGARWRL